MKRIENECVGCSSIGIPCLGNSCPNKNVVRFYCDKCGEERRLRKYNGEELCQDCLLKEFEVVDGSECYYW